MTERERALAEFKASLDRRPLSPEAARRIRQKLLELQRREKYKEN